MRSIFRGLHTRLQRRWLPGSSIPLVMGVVVSCAVSWSVPLAVLWPVRPAAADTLEDGFSRFVLGLKFATAALAGACPRTWMAIDWCREHVSGQLKPWIEKTYSEYRRAEGFDKFKHCTLSCVMAFQCGSASVLPIGGVKELWDVVDGYIPESIRGTSYDGIAEWADLDADYIGLAVSWAPTVQMRGEQDCSRACQVFYPLGTQ